MAHYVALEFFAILAGVVLGVYLKFRKYRC